MEYKQNPHDRGNDYLLKNTQREIASIVANDTLPAPEKVQRLLSIVIRERAEMLREEGFNVIRLPSLPDTPDDAA